LVSGRASTRAKDWLTRERCCALVLTPALTCVPEDWAVFVCAFGCGAVAPEFGVVGFCCEVVVEGAVCAATNLPKPTAPATKKSSSSESPWTGSATGTNR
jgi:hypothetical protein